MYSECIMNSASDGAERALTQCNVGLVFIVTHRGDDREERVWWFNLALSRMEGISF